MSAEPPIAFTRAHEALARQIAAAAGRSYIDWPDLYAAARQLPPNPANAPQPTPPAPTLQNEPTPARCPKKSRNVPIPSTRALRDTRQSAPSHADAPHPTENCKTNPSPPGLPSSPRLRPLTPNQLRAARFLTQGRSTNAIAATLHVDRHTLADWKRHPLFQQELRHLIDDPQPTTDN